MVFSAFNDPLDFLSGLLRDASVPHLQLDGRTGQQKARCPGRAVQVGAGGRG